ncbi:hypothetical protein OC846_001013 [Tilletia horrida]|uniref:F-box domain-containing protein n=1 Tax=Tilletia horrida TaxID=155126 RepID=A0AAN6GUN2_9BASI|nr:hypothetical protein OC846_001013 [Tilletia horrida]KAK0567362.1 hypothetical protein OC861_002772 [Tilletia horrida]
MRQRLPSTSDPNQPGSTNKRSRYDKSPMSSTPAQHFFNTPELVYTLLTYLSRERIDLLATSRVSKSLRVQSLKVWVRELDLPLTAARDRLLFFQANPILLDDIRFLRLRNDTLERDTDGHFLTAGRDDWRDFNELLKMLAERPIHPQQSPLIDLTIFPTGARHLSYSDHRRRSLVQTMSPERFRTYPRSRDQSSSFAA